MSGLSDVKKIESGESEVSPEIEKLMERATILLRTPDEIKITLPAKYMREQLSESQIEEFLKEILLLVNQSLRDRIQVKTPQVSR